MDGGRKGTVPTESVADSEREGASCRELEKVSRCINCQFDLSFFFLQERNFGFGARLARERARFTGMSAPDLTRPRFVHVHPI